MTKPATLPNPTPEPEPFTPEFNRQDICEAYLALEWDCHEGGILRERRSCERKMRSVGVQLHNMGFRTPAGFDGYESLTLNGKAIYLNACNRLGLLNLGGEK